MITRSFQWLVGGLLTGVVAGLLLGQPAARAQDKDKLSLDKIPKKVMDALKARFPKADINKWTKEKEGDVVIYDIEFKQKGQKFEADIKEDGTIHNWEKEIAASDLPVAVKKAVQKRYPKSTLKEIMAITAVKDGNDALEGYEIVLETADKKGVEVTAAPDGKILEDAGEKKETSVQVADGVSYVLEDGEERNRQYPDTFEIPSKEERQNLKAGQIVKLMFRITADGETQTERMWVVVKGKEKGGYLGILDNDPECTQKMKSGVEVRFEPRHVISIYASSAEFVGEFWFGQLAKCVI